MSDTLPPGPVSAHGVAPVPAADSSRNNEHWTDPHGGNGVGLQEHGGGGAGHRMDAARAGGHEDGIKECEVPPLDDSGRQLEAIRSATTIPSCSLGKISRTGSLTHAKQGSQEQQNQIYADTLIESCRQRLLVKNNVLDSLRSGSDKSQIKRATLTQTYLSSRPWMYAPSISSVHFLLVTVNLGLIVYVAFTIHGMVRLGVHRFNHYKMTALERRDNFTTALNPGPGVSAFGMIARENNMVVCSGSTEPTLSVTEENDMILSFPQADGSKQKPKWGGFYIVTSKIPGSQGEDPVKFKIEGSDDLTEWKTVASPSFTNYGNNHIFDFELHKFDVPQARGVKVVWDLKCPTAGYFAYFGTWLCASLVLSGLILLNVLCLTSWSHIWLTFSCSLLGFTGIVGSIFFSRLLHDPVRGGLMNEPNKQYFMISGIIYNLIAMLPLVWPRLPEIFVLGIGFGSLCLQVSFTGEFRWYILLSTLPFCIVGIVIGVFRILITRRTRRLMHEDRQYFAQEWEKVLLGEGGGIKKLDELVGKIHAAILRAGGGYPRQVNVKPVRVKMGRMWQPTLKGMGSASLRGLVPHSPQVSLRGLVQHSPQVSQPCDKDSPKTRNRSNSLTSMRSDVASFSMMNLPRPGKAWGPGIHGNWTYHQVLEGVSRFDTRYEADASNPIRSLDQLYSQATLLRPSLQSLILHLASWHRGMLPKKGSTGDYRRVRDPWAPDVDGMYEFGGVKAANHCIDKVDNACEGDVSFLLDVCREKLVFTTVADMKRCLKDISSNPNVSIQRIRSSMGPSGCDPRINSGYRFISLSIQISDALTRRLCVDKHVCEVIMVLACIDSMVDEEMKMRYRIYRSSVKPIWFKRFKSRWFTVRPQGSAKVHDDPLQSVHGSLSNSMDPGTWAMNEETDRAATPLCPSMSQPTYAQPEGDQTGTQWILRGNPVPDESDEKWKTSWGLELDNVTIRVLETLCRMSSLGYANILNSSMPTSHWLGIEFASTMSVIFTTRPIIAVSMKKTHIVWVFLIAITMNTSIVLDAIDPMMQIFPTNSFNPAVFKQSFRHFRYTSYLFRNGTQATSPGVLSFSPMINDEKGCRITSSATEVFAEQNGTGGDIFAPRVVAEGNTVTVSYSQAVPYRGWALSLGKDEGHADTSSFKVFASNAETDDPRSITGDAWTLVGTPRYSHSFRWPSMELFMPAFSPDKVTMPMPGDDPTSIFFFPGGTFFEEDHLHSTNELGVSCMGIGMLAFTVFGYLKLAEPARFCLLVAAFCNIWFTIDYSILRSEMRHSAVLGVFYTAIATTVFFMVLKERYFILSYIALAVLCLIDGIIDISLPASRPGSAIDVGFHLKVSITLIISLLTLALARFIALRRSAALVAEDRAKYDDLWRSAITSEDGLNSVTHLGKVVQMLGLEQNDDNRAFTGRANSALQQTSRSCLFLHVEDWMPAETVRTKVAPLMTRERVKGKDDLFVSLNCIYVPRTIDKANPVACVDQLFMQAVVANTLLVKKVKLWAEKANGCFRISDDCREEGGEGSNFCYWRDAMHDPDKILQIKWPPLKQHRRTVEKLMRVYNNDVSRLVDVSRQSIVFDTFTDLTMCLGEIVTDLDVKVERVKSKMSMTYDSSTTAGYRDVALNMKMDTDLACALGCDTHLCEVQLLLKKFGDLKTAEGHQRYVQHRDTRAE